MMKKNRKRKWKRKMKRRKTKRRRKKRKRRKKRRTHRQVKTRLSDGGSRQTWEQQALFKEYSDNNNLGIIMENN
jgi:hypothetical protein